MVSKIYKFVPMYVGFLYKASNWSTRCLVLPLRICFSVLYLSRPCFTFCSCKTSFRVAFWASLDSSSSRCNACNDNCRNIWKYRTWMKNDIPAKSTAAQGFIKYKNVINSSECKKKILAKVNCSNLFSKIFESKFYVLWKSITLYTRK